MYGANEARLQRGGDNECDGRAVKSLSQLRLDTRVRNPQPQSGQQLAQQQRIAITTTDSSSTDHLREHLRCQQIARSH